MSAATTVKHSKRYRSAASRVDRNKVYEPGDALALLKGLPAAKFDETVEVAVLLGIDPKKSDQLVRGAVSLPKGLGKVVRVETDPPGMGVVFTELNEYSQTLIAKLLTAPATSTTQS